MLDFVGFWICAEISGYSETIFPAIDQLLKSDYSSLVICYLVDSYLLLNDYPFYEQMLHLLISLMVEKH